MNKRLKILIVEGNLVSENLNFKKAGIQTHAQSLQESVDHFRKDIDYDIFNPSSSSETNKKIKNLEKYDGLVWGGSSLNIYNDTSEIRDQISFMKECFKKVKKILAICWGLQVAVTAAGGQVKKSSKGSHIGIAKNIKINQDGINHIIYKNKKNKFNSPAFNFDEVIKVPNNSTLLASNNINTVQALIFEYGKSKIWGLQYHPEITYDKMISLIKFRKDRLINFRNVFKNETEINNHIELIKNENTKLDIKDRMRELENWIKYLDDN